MTSLYKLNRIQHWLNGSDLTVQYILPSLLIIHEAQLERTQNSVSRINMFPCLNNLDLRSYKSALSVWIIELILDLA